MAAWVIALVTLTWTTVGMMLVTLALRSLVLAKLWAWFMVPLFAVPELSYAAAAGLMLVAMVFPIGSVKAPEKRVARDDQDEAEKKPMRDVIFELVIQTALVPMVLLILGWLIKGAL